MADAKELPALVQDPLVFLVDVTPNIVRRQLLGQGVNVMHAGLGWVRVEPPSLFAQMEDLGLEHFR